MPVSTETALITREAQSLTAAEIRSQVQRIQEVMSEVMSEGTHFGKIPGTDKPSLWKPGAEKLGLTFRIALDSQIDADLSTDDVVRYRVRTHATSQTSGMFLGSSLGECSSDEEKYKWRQAVCQAEFDETDIDRRRKKWKRDGSHIPQVRTNPADLANTILKMAVKRAEVATMLKVCAASDIFSQDLEDLPEEVRQAVAPEKPANGGNGGNGPTPKTAPAAPPETPAAAPADVISEAQAKRFYAIRRGRESAGWTAEHVEKLLRDHNISHDRAIPRRYYDALCKTIEKQTWDEYQEMTAQR